MKEVFQYRQANFLPDGRIDCEVRFLEGHPLQELGWMPYTADPDDPDEGSIGRELHKVAAADPRTKPVMVRSGG